MFIMVQGAACKQTRNLHEQDDEALASPESISQNQSAAPYINISIPELSEADFVQLTRAEEAEHLLDDANYQFILNLNQGSEQLSDKTSVYLKTLPIKGFEQEGLELTIKPRARVISGGGKNLDFESPRVKRFKIEHEGAIFGPQSPARQHMLPAIQTKQDYEIEGEVIGRLEDGSLIKLSIEDASLSHKQALDLADKELKLITKNLDKFKQSIRKPMKFSDAVSDDFIPIPMKVKDLRDQYFSINPPKEIADDIAAARVELKDDLKLFSNSSDLERVAPVYALVRKIYRENFGVDNYTWKTDGENEFGRGHYYDVASGLKQPMTVPKAIAAFMHDLERFFPSAKVDYLSTDRLVLLGGKTVDNTLRKKSLHPRNSAKLADLILDTNPRITAEEKSDIFDLILYHDASHTGLSLDFGFKGRQTVVEVLPPLKTVNPRILSDLKDLSDADALAFFRKTMPHFMLREIKKIKSIYGKQISESQINELLEIRVVETLFKRISLAADKRLAATWVASQKQVDPGITPHWEYVKDSILAKTSEL